MGLFFFSFRSRTWHQSPHKLPYSSYAYTSIYTHCATNSISLSVRTDCSVIAHNRNEKSEREKRECFILEGAAHFSIFHLTFVFHLSSVCHPHPLGTKISPVALQPPSYTVCIHAGWRVRPGCGTDWTTIQNGKNNGIHDSFFLCFSLSPSLSLPPLCPSVYLCSDLDSRQHSRAFCTAPCFFQLSISVLWLFSRFVFFRPLACHHQPPPDILFFFPTVRSLVARIGWVSPLLKLLRIAHMSHILPLQPSSSTCHTHTPSSTQPDQVRALPTSADTHAP